MLKKYLNYPWIKENLSMIILAPTLVGGMWQLLELGAIGTPYIRFFSGSQLIADGLLMAFIFFWAVVFYQLTNWALKTVDKGNGSPLKADQKVKKVQWLAVIIVVIFICAITYPFYDYYSDMWHNSNRISLTEILALLFYIVLMGNILIAIMGHILNVYQPKIDEQKLATYLGLPAGLLLTAIGYSLIYLVPLLSRSFLTPADFGNLHNIDCVIKKQHPELKSHDILYFNDQYIFIRTIDHADKELTLVEKFDTFFQKNCDSSTMQSP
jgi:hypothetical protein